MEVRLKEVIGRVDQAIKDKGTSRPSVCKALKIANSTFTYWEKGSMPSVDKLFNVASYLNVSLYWLLTGKDETGLNSAQRDLLRNYDKLDERDKQTVHDLIETMLKKQKKGDKAMYPDSQPVSYEAREPEPPYPQPVKIQKSPKIDNNVAAFVPVYYIPFYGKTAAGRPIDITIPPDRVIPVPAPVLKGDKSRYFSVEVRGTSMTNAGIRDGDYIIIRRAEEPESGKVMLVRYGNESTVKRVKMDGKKVILCWEDGSGKTIEVDSPEYEIQGEFVKLLRDID
jgi:SOS-response transcriptional repressor LexA